MHAARFAVALLSVATLLTVPARAQKTASTRGRARAALRIAAVDVEGGQATLFVAPTGQSLLVDTGWAGHDGRDADRIVAAAHDLGVRRIDTVVISHFHADHLGGVPQLVQRIPVGTFVDHGAVYEQGDGVPALYGTYKAVLDTGKYRHIAVRAGDKLPAPGFDGTVISSDGITMQRTLPGGGKGSGLCEPLPKMREDTTENGHSVAFVLRFAGVTILDAGDLTADRERQLVCPVNHVGNIDLAIVSHHGSDVSSSRVFVHSLHPRVAVMDNGAHKGGSTSVIDTWRSSLGLEALYQLHDAPPAGSKQPAGTEQGGPEHNVPESFIANPGNTDGKRIDMTVNADGTIDVTNQRTGQTKHFAHR